MQISQLSNLDSFKNLTPAGHAFLAKTLTEGPSRPVGMNSIGTSSGLFPSGIANHTVLFESQGHELPYLHLTELDPTVVYIRGQLPALTVVRNGSARKMKHVTLSKFDFINVRNDRITIVEVKPLAQVEKSHAQHPDEWFHDGTRWRFPPGEEAAALLGMSFEVAVPSADYSRIFLANLEALVSAKRFGDRPGDKALLKKAIRHLAEGPLSISELGERVKGLDGTTIIRAVLKKDLFAMLSIQSINDRMLIFAKEEDAVRREQQLKLMVPKIEQDTGSLASRFMRITSKEYDHAILVQSKYESLVSSGNYNSFYYRYRPKVVLAEEEGAPPIAAFIPDFSGRGLKKSLFGDELPKLIGEHLVQYLPDARKEHLGKTYADFKTYAEDKLPYAPSLETYRHYYYKAMTPEKRAQILFGLRGYQQNKPATDPRLRNIRCSIPGQVGHMDTTPNDAAAKKKKEATSKEGNAQKKQKGKKEERPLIVPIVDSATGFVLGRAINIGSADRLLTGTAQRDCVARLGILPQRIVVDRGSEVNNHQQRQLAGSQWVTFQNRPPAGATHGSEGEQFFSCFNSFTQSLPGSKYPDQKGRSADGKKKSRATAEFDLAALVETIDHWIFEIYNKTPRGDETLSPEELFMAGRERFPSGPVEVIDDDAFKYLTAMPLKGTSYNRKQGHRFANKWYSSPEMAKLINDRQKILELRLDCLNPGVIWARTTVGILPLFRGDYLEITDSSLATKAANYVRMFEYHPAIKKNNAAKTKKETDLIRKATSANKLNKIAASSADSKKPQKNSAVVPITSKRKKAEKTPAKKSSTSDATPLNIPKFGRVSYGK